jgi:hypothetical protein
MTLRLAREEKALFDVAGLDRNNKGFNAGCACIPNTQQWVFWYVFIFRGQTVASHVRLMVTDGCPQEINSVVANTGQGQSFPYAVHSLYDFHLAIVGWNKHVTTPSVAQSSLVWDTAINVIQDWIKLFEIEKRDKYLHSTGEFLIP